MLRAWGVPASVVTALRVDATHLTRLSCPNNTPRCLPSSDSAIYQQFWAYSGDLSARNSTSCKGGPRWGGKDLDVMCQFV